jgi:hypothetical protein
MQAGASRYIDRPPESRRGNDFTHHKNSGAPGGPTAERRNPIPFPTGVHSFPIQRGSEPGVNVIILSYKFLVPLSPKLKREL